MGPHFWFILSAAVRAIFDAVPIARPFFAPAERQAAAQAVFGRQIAFVSFAHGLLTGRASKRFEGAMRKDCMTTLIPIFADHLSHDLSALQFSNKASARILMVEVREEAETVPHHRKKLVFLFSVMRHFAQELRDDGWSVDYVKLTDADNTQSFTSEIKRALGRHDIDADLCSKRTKRCDASKSSHVRIEF
jgi:hypothetical protein